MSIISLANLPSLVSLHSPSSQAYHLPDPELSYLGILQCGQLRRHLQDHLPMADRIELVVTSPMRRTLQTASYALSWLLKRGTPFLARAEWQENSAKPCDTGSDSLILSREFPSIDFSLLDPEWPSKAGKYEYSLDAVQQRGVDARVWLKNRPESVIAVVTHSAFMRTSVAYARWANADYRVFEFAEDDEDGMARLVQWQETEERGGGLGRSRKGVMGVESDDFPTDNAAENSGTRA